MQWLCYDYIKVQYQISLVIIEKKPQIEHVPRDVKTILQFTKFFYWNDWKFGFGQKPFITNKCPVNNCYITNNRNMFGGVAQFDALIFHQFNQALDMSDLPDPRKRRPEQRYVFATMESPTGGGDYMDYQDPRLNRFFNWTMTYRLDSDIYAIILSKLLNRLLRDGLGQLKIAPEYKKSCHYIVLRRVRLGEVG